MINRKHMLDVALEIRGVSDSGTITGYGSVFGVLDSYNDIVAPGAFAKSVTEHAAAGSMPAMLWQHKSDEPIGVWTSMAEDKTGLVMEGQLAMDTVRGKEAHSLLKLGAIKGLSIGFYTRAYSYDTHTDVRTLLDVDLVETSLVTFPANRDAQVTSVRSIESIESLRDAELMLRDHGMTRAQATALVSRIKRMRPGDPATDDGPGDPVVGDVIASALRHRLEVFSRGTTK